MTKPAALLHIFVFIALLGGIACSQHLVINKINVYGTEQTSPELVKVNSGLEVGKPLSIAALQEAIRSIYALGSYEDVRILATKGPYGYDIEIRVKELPRLGKLIFKGNKKLKKSELEKVSKLQTGTYLSSAKIFRAIKEIQSKYAKEGLPGVEIKYELKASDKKGQVDLIFHINEKEAAYVEKIEFIGIKAFSPRKLKKLMETKEKSLFRSGKFDPEQYRKDLDKIEEYYHKKGYITAKIIRDSVGYSGKRIHIKIWLDEGKQYYLKEVKFVGNTIFDDEKLISLLRVKPGKVFNLEKMQQTYQDIYFAYTDEGYIHCQIDPKQDIKDDSVSVTILINEGKQAHVRLIEIVGNTRTFEKVIRRELVIYPGDVFRRNLLILSQRNVYFLNYFEEVVPEFRMLPNGDVDITFRVKEKSIGRFQVGAGYNARDKLVGTISIGMPNAFGRGWTLDLNYEFGHLRNNLSFSFTEPWLFDTPTLLGIDLYNTIWHWEGHYSELRRGGAIRLGRKLIKPRFFSIYTRYKLESVEIYDVSESYIPYPAYDITKIDWPQLESSIMLSIERDSRDSRLFATKGSKNSISVEHAGEFLGGDIEFQKVIVKSDWYFPLHKYLTFVFKANYGILTNMWGDPEKVPYGERFFPGGMSFDGQIRGYTDRSIGPLAYTEPVYDSTAIPDAAGRIPMISPSMPYQPGGRSTLTLNLELRVPIVKDQLYVFGFFDAGNAWLKPSQTRLSDLKRGAGFGVRFVVPMMGIFGLDFGYGFDLTKPGWQVHFWIGPEF